MRRYGALLVAFSALCFGCSASPVFFPLGHSTRHRPMHGQYIDPKVVSEIVPGETTKREITERFGKPDDIDKDARGAEQYHYDYSGFREDTDERIVWATKDTKIENETLAVSFKRDVVKNFTYTNSLVPEENLAK